MSLSRRQSLKAFAAAAAVPPAASAARQKAGPSVRLVVLDVGGTLIEDRGDIPETLRAALSHHGVASTPQEIGRLRGASKREVVRHFVDQQNLPPDTDRKQLAAAIYDDFTANLIAIYRSVPPVGRRRKTPMLRQLRQRGYLLATTTGFDGAITASIVHRLGWEQYFAATISSDDVTQGRPSPFMIFHAMEAARVDSVLEVMAVGDTPLDLQAGTNAGLRAVVGVLSGAGTAETLRREPHTHILPSVAALPSLLPPSPAAR